MSGARVRGLRSRVTGGRGSQIGSGLSEGEGIFSLVEALKSIEDAVETIGGLCDIPELAAEYRQTQRDIRKAIKVLRSRLGELHSR